jgi:hypothetical protein
MIAPISFAGGSFGANADFPVANSYAIIEYEYTSIDGDGGSPFNASGLA